MKLFTVSHLNFGQKSAENIFGVKIIGVRQKSEMELFCKNVNPLIHNVPTWSDAI